MMAKELSQSSEITVAVKLLLMMSMVYSEDATSSEISLLVEQPIRLLDSDGLLSRRKGHSNSPQLLNVLARRCWQRV